MKVICILLGILCAVSAEDYPDAKRNFTEVCTAHGWRVETHNVTTADNYILTLFRIPGAANQPLNPNKKVVFLQHGLLDCADTWIMDLPDSPGFQFAQAGYDVWFGNSRGNYHSLGHVTLNAWKDLAYWNFTWQDMADYDLPAVIPYVLQTTGQKKLTYIGHSQGTLQMFAHLSSNQTFINNINIFIALAPVGTVRHIKIDFFFLIKKFPLFDMMNDLGIGCFLPYDNAPGLNYDFCELFSVVCDWVDYALADMITGNDNDKMLPTIFAHEAGGTSVRNMQHWQQMTNYDTYRVQKYDYGDHDNEKIYGQKKPPVYNFAKIPGPIALFFGKDDRLADPTDGAWLRGVIPAKSIVYQEETYNFGHMTFVWGKNMTWFSNVIALANNYSSNAQEENSSPVLLSS
ncbi:unnamed protein product [Blepharisma stoltei]|uniref:Lipase n=1 Tax=Blepharisma stoltei TaxID=1481888 RepID=A0AAU9IJX4_9CILI|nr:unnamed protein product [Blepharisma stoltei]